MAVFVCEQTPDMVVMAAGRGVIARFRDGRATVGDADTAAVLRSHPGVTELDTEPTPDLASAGAATTRRARRRNALRDTG